MKQQIEIRQLPNGLTLLMESMPWLKSAAFAISTPAGAQFDPETKLGLANLTCEMMQRGCGERNSRQFIEDLERLGVDSNGSVSHTHMYFGGAMPADSLSGALPIFSDLVQKPRFPFEQLEEARFSCMQEIRGIEDDLSQRVMIELRRLFFPEPFARNSAGTVPGLEAISPEDVIEHFRRTVSPQETMIGVAGQIDFDRVFEQVAQAFGDWKAPTPLEFLQRPAIGGNSHIEFDSAQTHIALAFPSVPYRHADYFLARSMIGVLSDGMSSRLFTEVREKRGLCYTVFASMNSTRDVGSVVCYAGTTTDRAQETLDVMLAELRRLKEGVDQGELDRLKVQIRSNLIMQQESSRSRVASLIGDWYHLGRVRSTDELNSLVQNVTLEELNRYLSEHPAGPFTLVTLGKQPLEFANAVSSSSA